ncbi:MAG: LamG domain-containing protein, partial [Pseudomonadota bacterium]
LVDDTTARAAYFPGLDFNADPSVAFASPNVLLDPLVNNMVGNGISTQPDDASLRAEVTSLVTRLSTCAGACPADQTENVVKGACASILGSAAMLVN